MSRRMRRVNELLREELARQIARLKDPRLSSGLVSITEVETSADLGTARVFVSVLAGPEEQERTVQALNQASGFLRRALGDALALKRIPRLQFILDRSLERGARLSALMDRLMHPPEGEGA